MYIAEHRRLKARGIVEVKPFRGKREHAVILESFRTGLVGPFSGELEVAVAAKAVTLAREQGS